MVRAVLLDTNKCHRNVYLAFKSSTGKLLEKELEHYASREPSVDLAEVLLRWPSASEHCVLTFYIECTRACMDEMTRHRHLSFTVSSTRYSKSLQPGDFEWVDIGTADRLESTITGMIGKAGSSGMEQEYWRLLLPLGIKATAIVTGNLRAWRHFYCVRRRREASPEIRLLAGLVGEIIKSRLLNGKDIPCPDFNP